MRAMILAAGKGNRLRPLTDTCPKPLITVLGKPLIAYHIENLRRAGVTDIVINVSHLGEKIQQYCGNGAAWGVSIRYSEEPSLLEVGGGICNALPLLGQDPFIVVSGDIWTDYPFSDLPNTLEGNAHLIVVDNPPWHPAGDFSLNAPGKLLREHVRPYTYANIALLHPTFFDDTTPGTYFPFAPLLDKAIAKGMVTGAHYKGQWENVGTLELLKNLENKLSA